MIRMAEVRDLCISVDSEAAIRILSAYEAYGIQSRFLQIFTDGEGTLVSLMDGVAVIHAPRELSEEWQCFLSMHTDIKTVRTDRINGTVLAALWGTSIKTGDFMSYHGAPADDLVSVSTARYEDLYSFLSEYFTLPPFDCWYVDVSHRVRHGMCHIATLVNDGQVISNAMTVAETSQDALLGAVATHPEWRQRGLAGDCINHLICQLPKKGIHISPVDDRAKRLYEKLGFVVVGSWAELPRHNGG